MARTKSTKTSTKTTTKPVPVIKQKPKSLKEKIANLTPEQHAAMSELFRTFPDKNPITQYSTKEGATWDLLVKEFGKPEKEGYKPSAKPRPKTGKKAEAAKKPGKPKGESKSEAEPAKKTRKPKADESKSEAEPAKKTRKPKTKVY